MNEHLCKSLQQHYPSDEGVPCIFGRVMHGDEEDARQSGGFAAPQQQPVCGLTAGRGSSLPVKQVLSASRAANTAAWPSSGARILGRAPTAVKGHGHRPKEDQEEEKEEEEEAAAAEGDRCCSFPHPPVIREERTPKNQVNNDRKKELRRRRRRRQCSITRTLVCVCRRVSAFPRTPATWTHTDDWLTDRGSFC